MLKKHPDISSHLNLNHIFLNRLWDWFNLSTDKSVPIALLNVENNAQQPQAEHYSGVIRP